MIGGGRNLLWLIPLGLFVSSPLWQERAAAFLRPRGGYDAAAMQAYSQEERNFVMDDVVLHFSADGKQTWTVKAVQAHTAETDREIEMTEVNAVYAKEGDSPMTVTSRKGRYQMDKKHLTLIDDVVVIKPVQHEELRTELLHYYDLTKKLISPDAVRINGPNFNLEAGQMEYEVSAKDYQFDGRVHVVM